MELNVCWKGKVEGGGGGESTGRNSWQIFVVYKFAINNCPTLNDMMF